MRQLNFISCDVSDALLKLKHPHGGFLSHVSLWSPQRQEGSTKIVGPAYTVKYVLLSDTTSPKHEGHYVGSPPRLGFVGGFIWFHFWKTLLEPRSALRFFGDKADGT